MILSISANPSVDISYEIDSLEIDDVNRVDKLTKDAGGKGIHVSFVLNQLGNKVINSGFVGGKLGEFIEESLDKRQIESRFEKISAETRNCIAILHQDNQTEILEKGPLVTKEEEERFLNNLDNISKGCDIINISGSLPQGLDSSFYLKIIKYAKEKGKFVSVDTSGKSLNDVIKADIKPDLIKPNETEIKDVVNKDIEKIEDVKGVLLQEPFKSIKYVILSRGKDGALVKINQKIYRARVPKIEAINPVGSGDSSLAGAISAIENGDSDIELIKKSMTCGLLNALNSEIAKIDMDLFEEYYKKIKVEEII